ncbi:hypothetical protein [Serratia marcescens]|uniref:hypothetical protein n=1 Tax=Serratia marcescens TaxID=615 RepID=UPI000A5A3792|nr:hypothetical protein [Serratia marcescens]
MLLSTVLVWGQSRTGWLTGALMLGLFVLRFSHRYPQVIALAFLLVICGAVAAVLVLVLWWGHELGDALCYASHANSNHERYTMLHDERRKADPWLRLWQF